MPTRNSIWISIVFATLIWIVSFIFGLILLGVIDIILN